MMQYFEFGITGIAKRMLHRRSKTPYEREPKDTKEPGQNNAI
jgi:hypothetical protein